MRNCKWILLAEDDTSTAELMKLSLGAKAAACEIVIAQDGLTALDCIRHRGEFLSRDDSNPLFVLLDLKMPKVDGLEVLREIKSDERLKNIPVVMFTSSRELADIAHSYQLGVNAYVVKPVDFQKFNEALKCIWEFWAMTNEPPQVTPPVAAEKDASAKDPVPPPQLQKKA